MIVSAFSNSKLSFEVLERKETMGGIEFLIVLAVAYLYFSIVPWCTWLDQLVTNIKLLQVFSKSVDLGFLVPTSRFVNSLPLSVCTHSMA